MSSQSPLIFDKDKLAQSGALVEAAPKGDSKEMKELLEQTSLDSKEDIDDKGRLKIPHILTETKIKWELDLTHALKESEKEYLKKLKVLDLYQIYAGKKDFLELAIFVKKYFPSLEKLRIHDVDDFGYLASLLDSNSTIKVLEVHDYSNRNSLSSIRALGEILKTNKTLERLTFENLCKLPKEELGPLTDAFAHNTTLISIENIDLRRETVSADEAYIQGSSAGCFFNGQRIATYAECNANVNGIASALARNLELSRKKHAEKVVEASTSAASATAKP